MKVFRSLKFVHAVEGLLCQPWSMGNEGYGKSIMVVLMWIPLL